MQRREFIAGLAAIGASALVPDVLEGAQTRPPASAQPFLIDVHYHGNSPGFIAAIKARNTGQTALMNWTPAKALEDMDRDGVATSIMSTSEPSVYFGDAAAARALARECNDYFARLVSDHPTRFGMFATLPLPDVDGALKEIEYAYDTLKADGVCFMSSYEGKYLGDPAFAPVMDELNRRKAVAYTHPFRGAMANMLPEGRNLGITLSTETTVTIQSILYTNTATRCPDIRFIWSHGGGTAPYITSRLGAAVGPDGKPNANLAALQKFYYDTAQAFNPYTLATFTKVVPNSHILFGTDYPFAQAGTVAKGLAESGFTPASLRAIERDNALELFPRLKKT
ncbi:MAG TPA: amidohydrolase family protein [Vicinamibacterales bacterium]|jgi:predicted TIM-barrel fold metal-dependent hydrolase